MRQHNDHPPESTDGSQRASLEPAGPGASQATWAVPDVRLVQRLQTAAGNAAVTDLLTHPPTVGLTLQRRPADVGATPALTLKSGCGFLAILATPWDHLQTALRDHASLKDDQYAARAAVLNRLPVLITDWELHHNVGTAQLNAEEKRELAVLTAGVDEATQAVKAGRFKGDPLLEQVMVGALTVGLGNSGLYVTKLQQALADMPYR